MHYSCERSKYLSHIRFCSYQSLTSRKTVELIKKQGTWWWERDKEIFAGSDLPGGFNPPILVSTPPLLNFYPCIVCRNFERPPQLDGANGEKRKSGSKKRSRSWVLTGGKKTHFLLRFSTPPLLFGQIRHWVLATVLLQLSKSTLRSESWSIKTGHSAHPYIFIKE